MLILDSDPHKWIYFWIRIFSWSNLHLVWQDKHRKWNKIARLSQKALTQPRESGLFLNTFMYTVDQYVRTWLGYMISLCNVHYWVWESGLCKKFRIGTTTFFKCSLLLNFVQVCRYFSFLGLLRCIGIFICLYFQLSACCKPGWCGTSSFSRQAYFYTAEHLTLVSTERKIGSITGTFFTSYLSVLRIRIRCFFDPFYRIRDGFFSRSRIYFFVNELKILFFICKKIK